MLRFFSNTLRDWLKKILSTFSSDQKQSEIQSRLACIESAREWTSYELLDRAATTSVYNLRVQKMVITIDKFLNYNFNPKYLENLLTLRSVVYSHRGNDMFVFSKPSTSYGLHSFKYFACKTWSFRSLQQNFKTEPT